jgi:hypothetical protein
MNATSIHFFEQECDQMAIDHKMMDFEVYVLYLAVLFLSTISVRQTSHKAWPKSRANALATTSLQDLTLRAPSLAQVRIGGPYSAPRHT